MPSFTSYLPPGVYVDSGAIPPIAPVGVNQTVVCIIGPGIGYHTYTETVSFASASSAVLTQRGIDPTSVVVTGFVTDPSAPGQTLDYTFTKDIPGSPIVPEDYSLSVDATAGVDATVTTITRTSTGKIETGNPQVTVTYRYTDADYHALHYFDDFDTLVNVYGQPLDPVSGAIVSPLSLAAQIAIENGANFIYTVALNGVGALSQQFTAAYRLLQGNYDVNLVVPIWPGMVTTAAVSGMMQLLKPLVENDADDGYLRMALVGVDKGYGPTFSDLSTLAITTSSDRVVLAWPNTLQLYNGVVNANVDVDGWYLAAAYAGMLAKGRPQTPLTRKYPIGFAGMSTVVQQSLTKSVKNQLSSSGVCLTEVDRLGRLVVRHGLTTNFAGGVLNREISLLRAQDALYNLVQQTLENADMIGTPIDAQTGIKVKGIVQGVLEQAVTYGLIFGYNNVKVRQQNPPSGDPTIIEVKFAYQPSYPLNYILVSFTIDTTTGELNGSATDPTTTNAITSAANNAAASTS